MLVAIGLAGLAQAGPNGVWEGFGHDETASYAYNPMTVTTPSASAKAVTLKSTFNALLGLKGYATPAATMVQRLTVQCQAKTYQVSMVTYYDASGNEIASKAETAAPSAITGGASAALAGKVCQ